jgi:hypothetical protein
MNLDLPKLVRETYSKKMDGRELGLLLLDFQDHLFLEGTNTFDQCSYSVPGDSSLRVAVDRKGVTLSYLETSDDFTRQHSSLVKYLESKGFQRKRN